MIMTLGAGNVSQAGDRILEKPAGGCLMPRRQEPEEALASAFTGCALRLWLIAGVILMVSTVFAWHATEEFLIKDDRFRVAESDDYRGRARISIVEGVQYASLPRSVMSSRRTLAAASIWFRSQSGAVELLDDRLGGGRIRFAVLAERADGADSRAQAGGIRQLARPKTDVALGADRSTKGVILRSARGGSIHAAGADRRPRVGEPENAACACTRVLRHARRDLGRWRGRCSEIDATDPNNSDDH